MSIPRSHRPDFLKPSLWDRGTVIGWPGQKPDRKKWPGPSDSDMVPGGLKNRKKSWENESIQKFWWNKRKSLKNYWENITKIKKKIDQF